MHSMKKKFEEERVKSSSYISMRSSGDLSKMKKLENELTKKDDKIRKL